MRSPRPRLGDATMPLRGLMTTLMVLKHKQEIKLRLKDVKTLPETP